jgi:hypothetical protein
VDGAHAGSVGDFNAGSELHLLVGEHEIELRLDGHRTLRQRVGVTLKHTYKIRHQMEPLGRGDLAGFAD